MRIKIRSKQKCRYQVFRLFLKVQDVRGSQLVSKQQRQVSNAPKREQSSGGQQAFKTHTLSTTTTGLRLNVLHLSLLPVLGILITARDHKTHLKQAGKVQTVSKPSPCSDCSGASRKESKKPPVRNSAVRLSQSLTQQPCSMQPACTQRDVWPHLSTSTEMSLLLRITPANRVTHRYSPADTQTSEGHEHHCIQHRGS